MVHFNLGGGEMDQKSIKKLKIKKLKSYENL
jgi:hypothetical protein